MSSAWPDTNQVCGPLPSVCIAHDVYYVNYHAYPDPRLLVGAVFGDLALAAPEIGLSPRMMDLSEVGSTSANRSIFRSQKHPLVNADPTCLGFDRGRKFFLSRLHALHDRGRTSISCVRSDGVRYVRMKSDRLRHLLRDVGWTSLGICAH